MFTLGLPSEDGAAQGLAIQAEQGGGVGVKLDGLEQATKKQALSCSTSLRGQPPRPTSVSKWWHEAYRGGVGQARRRVGQRQLGKAGEGGPAVATEQFGEQGDE